MPRLPETSGRSSAGCQSQSTTRCSAVTKGPCLPRFRSAGEERTLPPKEPEEGKRFRCRRANGPRRWESGDHPGIPGSGAQLRTDRFPGAAAGRRRAGPAGRLSHPQDPGPRRHGRRLPGRRSQAGPQGGHQGHAAAPGRQQVVARSASCARPGPPPPSSTITSSPSTRSARTAAFPSWPCSSCKASRSTSG